MCRAERAFLALLLLVVACHREGTRRPTAGLRCVYELEGATPASLEEAARVVRGRLEASYRHDFYVLVEGGHIVVELGPAPGDDVGDVKGMIRRVGRLEFLAVEDGSEFMKRLATRVRQDPRAPGLGVTVETDQWDEHETGRFHEEPYLVGTARSALEEYLASLGSDARPDAQHQLPLAAEERDVAGRPTHRVRTYYVVASPGMTGERVKSAEVFEEDDPSRSPAVSLEFDERGKAEFAELTRRLTGHKMAIVLDGMIMSAPIVQMPITGGRATITLGAGDPQTLRREAEELAVALGHGPLPAPLRLLTEDQFGAR